MPQRHLVDETMNKFQVKRTFANLMIKHGCSTAADYRTIRKQRIAKKAKKAPAVKK